jgi:pimeloyl-ACP methyl ester carboxylesterase
MRHTIGLAAALVAALAEDMARRIPGARLAIVRGAGHLSNLEQPEAFNAAVLPFLLEHRDRASPARPPKQ